jgi:hypothetical protein
VLYDGSLPTLDNYKLNSAMNPPLTNITNANAVAACTGRTAPTISGMAALLNADLPEKKDYMAYSSAPVGMLDPQISELEQGFSLDIQSRCNGSSASGVTAGYTDLEVPPSAYKYSIPGTATSGIRSVVTGSVPVGAIFSSTESCVSRFGVQDVYGNVAEWVKDQMYCNGNTSNNPFTCTTGCPISNPGWNLPQASEPLATTAGQYYYDTTNSLCKKSDGAAWIAVTTLSTDMHYNFGTSSVSAGGSNPTYYGLDNITGPFNDADASGHPSNGDIYLTDWDYVDRLYSAGNFSFPLGLPIHTDIETIATNISTWLTSGRAPTLLNIGVGITAAQLHGDGIIVNAYDVVTKGGGSTGSGNFAVGGSYKSGTRSGRFTMELVPTSTDTRNDIGFRCIIPVTNGKYTTDSKHPYGY